MIKLFRAELRRLWKSPAFWLCLAGMVVATGGFVWMQATAMDYTVPISRVIFLPLTLWGMASAAFLSFFLGQDFSGGFVRCKLLNTGNRRSYVLAQLAVAAVGSGMIYLAFTGVCCLISWPLFAWNVEGQDFFMFLLIGLGMTMAQGCFFASVTLLCGSQAKGILAAMALAFGMLILALNTNSILIQAEYKDGIWNPSYIDGATRQVYLLLHNLNPTGQAAQLSAWSVSQPGYAGCGSLLLALASGLVGWLVFEKKDIG